MKRSNEPLIIIIIVNYNGLEDTIECLESIQKVDYQNYKIILVDNASKYFPEKIIKENFPEIILIRSDQNLGFTGGNNLGLSTAYELAPQYILCLNNDTIVSENILAELSLFMDSHQDVGLIGPLTCYYRDRQKVAFGGANINRNTGLIYYINKNAKHDQLKEETVYCSFIEGAALFIRCDLFRRIGGFNDVYFLTSEESELCVKVHDAGYKMAVLTSCCVWHKVSQSIVATSELSSYFIFRNKLLFVKNNRNDFKLKHLFYIVEYYLKCLISFSIKKKKYAACKGLILGVFDFFLGREGVGRFKETLS